MRDLPEYEAGLILCEEGRVQPKDFRYEVRGWLDVDHLLEEAVVRSNETETDVEKIIMGLARDMARDFPSERVDLLQIKNELFAFDGTLGARIARRIQAFDGTPFGMQTRQSWIVTFGSVDGLLHRHVGFSRLRAPTNLGEGMEDVTLVAVVLAPLRDKGTKSAEETARSFSTLLMNDLLRLELMHAHDIEAFKEAFRNAASTSSSSGSATSVSLCSEFSINKTGRRKPGAGIAEDFQRRYACYWTDWLDGVKDLHSLSKSISTVLFLLCTIMPTSVAYGMLNDANTGGLINVQKVMLGQAIGGVFFALLGGQPMLILSTTAPLSIYIQVIYNISLYTGWSFYPLYVCVGLWSQLFLAVAALFHAADLLQYTKRSTEEMFSLFISAALTYKAVRAAVESYLVSFASCGDPSNTTMRLDNVTEQLVEQLAEERFPMPDEALLACSPQTVLLFCLLALATFWFSCTLDAFRHTPFLTRVVRNLLSDYALPLSIAAMALIAHFLFYNVPKATFSLYGTADFGWTVFWDLSFEAHAVCFGLAIPLSVLFFVDQLLVTKTVDNKQNKLSKGPAHHWDLLVVAALNVFLSLAALPWMHGALPSAYLHLRSLADVEERLHDGRIQQVIVRAREARPAVFIAHLLVIFIYIYALPFISAYIPTSLFQGLFLYMAASSLGANQLWHRLMLLVTEQRAYPPTSYIRAVPQRTVHLFTLVEALQLVVLLVVGLSPLFYLSMLFPLVIALFVPIRIFLLPLVFNKNHLEVIDGSH